MRWSWESSVRSLREERVTFPERGPMKARVFRASAVGRLTKRWQKADAVYSNWRGELVRGVSAFGGGGLSFRCRKKTSTSRGKLKRVHHLQPKRVSGESPSRGAAVPSLCETKNGVLLQLEAVV